MRLEKSEEGFTLVELLVVILIIGILASIAIPVFLNQRQTANDAAVESNVHSLALTLESHIVEKPNATVFDQAWVRANTPKNTGVGLYIYGDPKDYCITGVHTNGKKYRNGVSWEENNMVRPYVMYSSKVGGMANGFAVTSLTCDDSGLGFGV